MDKNAVAIISYDSWEKETIVGHVLEKVFKTSSMFLKVSNTSIEVQFVGKRLKHGRGYGLEISVSSIVC